METNEEQRLDGEPRGTRANWLLQLQSVSEEPHSANSDS